MTATIIQSKYLDEADWKLLLPRIKNGRCTPLLGPCFAPTSVPLSGYLAQQLAKEYDTFPFVNETQNLRLVAQYIASKGLGDPQEAIQRLLRQASPPDPKDPMEPHRLLAGMPFPVYLSTNQTNFLFDALKAKLKDARQATCHWWEMPWKENDLLGDADYVPTAARPLVYHLFGHQEVYKSLVVSEDHHLEFLANVSGEPTRIPLRIQQYFGQNSTILFLGFRPDQLEFRILLRSIVRMCHASKHVAVQVFNFPDALSAEHQVEARNYLEAQFCSLNQTTLKIRICWGDCTEFLQELKDRWEIFNDN